MYEQYEILLQWHRQKHKQKIAILEVQKKFAATVLDTMAVILLVCKFISG